MDAIVTATTSDQSASKPMLRLGILGAGMIATVSYGFLPRVKPRR